MMARAVTGGRLFSRYYARHAWIVGCHQERPFAGRTGALVIRSLVTQNNSAKGDQCRNQGTLAPFPRRRIARRSGTPTTPTTAHGRTLAALIAEETKTRDDHREFRNKPIQILYASQTGTAQLFAMQLAEALDREKTENAEYGPLASFANALSRDTKYVLLLSTTGVGEPPDNGRAFYQWLNQLSGTDALRGVQYAIFALGNSKAHPQHYCAFGKNLQRAMNAAGAEEFMEMTLGDDGGECLEDDFDQWQDKLLNVLKGMDDVGSQVTASAAATTTSTGLDHSPAYVVEDPHAAIESDTQGTRPDGYYPKLKLKVPDSDSRRTIVPAPDLLDKAPTFYAAETKRYAVQRNHVIRSDAQNAATNPGALRELQIQIGNSDAYGTGDHLMVYPRNSDIVVDAYCAVLQDAPVDPHSIVEGVANESDNDDSAKPYPHPLGITIYETLRHCVDLQALPSPSFARFLTGKSREELDYKAEIAMPRKTVLELLLEGREAKISLENLLYQLPPMKPRYYSIASSQRAHPDTIFLTYRPVEYVTTRGVIRNGLCTGFLASIPSGNSKQSLVARICSNPPFRLPETLAGETPPPILLLAGGCGVAPIRAFLEELIWNARQQNPKPYGKVHLFLGFRNPEDSVYSDILAEANKLGIVDGQSITYTTGCVQCALVSDAVANQGATVYRLIDQENASAYVCGGARTFGVAIQNAIQQVLQDHGGLNELASTAYMRHLIQSGRFHEDLSD